MGLFFEVESLDMRSPAVVLPTKRYFAETAAKMSPCRTLTPRYTRCSSSSVRVLLLVPKRVKGYGDKNKTLILPHSDPSDWTQTERVGMVTTSAATAKAKS